MPAMKSTEEKLWQLLRNRNLGHKYCRQHPIGHLINNFYCSEVKVVEIDSDIHRMQEEFVAARMEWLQPHGYSVICFQKDVLLNYLDDMKRQIHAKC